MNKSYLGTFFQEKNINYQIFEIEDSKGYKHIIDTDCVIEAIYNSSQKEQQIISLTLQKLDYFNKPIIGYLKFLAIVLVKRFE